MSHFILTAIAARSAEASRSLRAAEIPTLCEYIDLAVASTFGNHPADVVSSVGPGVVMLAFPDPEPSRPLRLLESISRQLEATKARGVKTLPLAAVLTAGPMKQVDVLGTTVNFEGQPAIAAARILKAVREGQVLVDSSLAGFSDLVAECGPEEFLTGKHSSEVFRVRRHSRIHLGVHASSAANGGSAEEIKPSLPRPNDNDAPLSSVTLAEVIQKHEWIVGAINFDEDLHFSCFYLRQSSSRNLPRHLKRYGYSTVIAVYEDFDEAYYIPQSECIRVAQALLETILADPSWLQKILDETQSRVARLATVFPFKEDETPFAGMSTERLLSLYSLHKRHHTEVYEVARIPEALDRGVGRFTTYLRDYLKHSSGASKLGKKELNELWEIMTFPEQMSTVLIELAEFQQLVGEIKTSPKKREVFSRGFKRALLHLDADTRSRILEHRKKWSFLGYHGYGSRALPDITDYLERLARALLDDRELPLDPDSHQRLLRKAERARNAAFRQLGVDGNHQLLFRLHSRVGVTKLQRRFVQLRNFYFLDQLLAEIAARKGVPEAEVRSLLPEEVESFIGSSQKLTAEQKRRTRYAIYLLAESGECVFGGPEFRWAETELKRRATAKQVQEGKIHGDPVSGGVVRGRAKIIIRHADAERVGFSRGDILISESTDPDLRFLIAEAGGVITESGGATCHAAVYCREIHKPALVGVPNLLDIIRNDDRVVLNASEGFFSILPAERSQLLVEDIRAEHEPVATIGAKAATLSKLLKAGLPIPRFFVLPIAVARERLGGPTSDASAPSTNELLDEVRLALEYLNGELFLIRSSMADEDGAATSKAGFYASESMVERQDVVPALVQYLEDMFQSLDPATTGGIIVQEMVLGDVSGVCLTIDPVTGAKQRMIIEAVPGGNEELTSGKVVPVHYAIDRQTGSIVSEDTHGQWRGLLDSDLMRDLTAKALEVERLLGDLPQDIEWTAKGRRLWLLQARPVSEGGNPEAVVTGFMPTKRGPRPVSSIYRAYRVPPRLQLHLLRVAAVGAVLVDNWIGPPVNRRSILTTLLLHDIGNIVKVDYERFPALLPEELENLQYWKAAQSSVIERYGGNDQEVAIKIARELAVPAHVIDLLRAKRFVLNDLTLASNDWNLKICAYSDQRVSPTGVLPLVDRLKEARERYQGVVHASVNDPRFDFLMECAIGIEKQLAEHVTVQLGDLTDQVLSAMVDELRSYTLQTE